MTVSTIWLLALPLIISTYGFSRNSFTRQDNREIRWFIGIVVTLCLASIAMVILLTVRSMTPGYIGAAFSAIALLGLLRYRGAVKIEPGEPISPSYLLIAISIAAVAICLRLNPAAHLFGGQDPGVYMNTGNLIARHGTHFYTDTTIPLVKHDPKHFNYYLNKTYFRSRQHPDGSWFGNLTPGTYISDLSKDEHVTQFYPVTHAWLALGSLLFGPTRSTWILLPFSLMGIAAVGLIVKRLTRSTSAAFVASALLAINAAHAAISISPLSEIIASFFFLSGLFFLISSLDRERISNSSSYLMICTLCFTNLFFTRITGFITLPLILISLIPMAAVRKKRVEKIQLALFGLGCIAAYIASFLWGLTYSRPYSLDIYRGKLMLDAGTLTPLLCFIALCSAGWLLLIGTTKYWMPLRIVLRKHRTWIGSVFVAVVFAILIIQGFLIGFTDFFLNHRWIGKRWQIAGNGWGSLPYMSFLVLGLLASPLGYIAGICGISYSFRRALTTSVWVPICVLSAGFFVALTVKQTVVPYLYYFARYQVSELLPLIVIVGTCFLNELIRKRNHRTRLIFWSGYLTLCGLFFIKPALGRLQETEGDQFSKALACIDAVSAGKTIIAIDRQRIPVTVLLLPLRYTYDKKTIAISSSDFASDDELDLFFEFYRQQGYSVMVLSAPDKWKKFSRLKQVVRFPIRSRKFRGDQRGQLRLPDHYGGNVTPVMIYRYQSALNGGDATSSNSSQNSELPEVCKELR